MIHMKTNVPVDMTVPCDDGLINIRVGAIILRNGKFLMVGNRKRPEYLYSVGGRVKFGETAEQAVRREVFEETKVHMEVDRLGFVHENYFYGDNANNKGKVIYELSFYFYMEVPADFNVQSGNLTDQGDDEYLTWIEPDDPIKYYPTFFRTELKNPSDGVKFFTADER